MRRYLIVAHRTLGGTELRDRVKKLVAEEPSRFHILVPVTHPADHNWTEGEVIARAKDRLAEGIAQFASMGIEATGEVGDVNPVYAVAVLMKRDEIFDGILLSTLPPGLSRWLKLDVPTRLQREVDCPVEIIISRASGEAVA